MGSVVTLFSAVFDLSLLKGSTLSQVKYSVFICIKLCFPRVVSVPRPSLDTLSLQCPRPSPTSHAGPSWAPTLRWRLVVKVSQRIAASLGAAALGKGARHFWGAALHGCSPRGVDTGLWGKPGVPSPSSSGWGNPMAWA